MRGSAAAVFVLLSSCQPGGPDADPEKARATEAGSESVATETSHLEAGAPGGPTVAPGSPTAPPTGSGAGAAADRVVAVGDLHGDLRGTRAVLKVAGLIDDGDRWVGGHAHLVQVGDVLDRGDEERPVLELLERLEVEARAAGGAVHVLHGNHELWNVAGNFRYVNPAGFDAFADYDDGDAALGTLPARKRGRRAAFRPGGPWALKLADHPVVLQLADTVFVHGGVLPKHAEVGLEAINEKARAFLQDGDRAAYAWLVEWDSPLMSRHYSEAPSPGDCALLGEALSLLGARRMVVAHIVQLGGIAPACGEKVWRIDTGIAARYGGRHEALEIRGDVVRVLRPPG